jgi:hypothetical protein
VIRVVGMVEDDIVSRLATRLASKKANSAIHPLNPEDLYGTKPKQLKHHRPTGYCEVQPSFNGIQSLCFTRQTQWDGLLTEEGAARVNHMLSSAKSTRKIMRWMRRLKKKTEVPGAFTRDTKPLLQVTPEALQEAENLSLLLVKHGKNGRLGWDVEAICWIALGLGPEGQRPGHTDLIKWAGWQAVAGRAKKSSKETYNKKKLATATAQEAGFSRQIASADADTSIERLNRPSKRIESESLAVLHKGLQRAQAQRQQAVEWLEGNTKLPVVKQPATIGVNAVPIEVVNGIGPAVVQVPGLNEQGWDGMLQPQGSFDTAHARMRNTFISTVGLDIGDWTDRLQNAQWELERLLRVYFPPSDSPDAWMTEVTRSLILYILYSLKADSNNYYTTTMQEEFLLRRGHNHFRADLVAHGIAQCGDRIADMDVVDNENFYEGLMTSVSQSISTHVLKLDRTKKLKGRKRLNREPAVRTSRIRAPLWLAFRWMRKIYTCLSRADPVFLSDVDVNTFKANALVLTNKAGLVEKAIDHRVIGTNENRGLFLRHHSLKHRMLSLVTYLGVDSQQWRSIFDTALQQPAELLVEGGSIYTQRSMNFTTVDCTESLVMWQREVCQHTPSCGSCKLKRNGSVGINAMGYTFYLPCWSPKLSTPIPMYISQVMA